MASPDPSGGVLCTDTSGQVSVEAAPTGGLQYVKSLSPLAATPGYRDEVTRLQQVAAAWAVPLVDSSPTRLVFARGDCVPFGAWAASLGREQFYPLERAVRGALGLCTTVRDSWAHTAGGYEVHSGVVLVTPSDTPSCRLLLWPSLKAVRPADFLRCSPDVLVSTPPEAFCGQPPVQPQVYGVATMLHLLFAQAAPPGEEPGTLVERLVGEGLPVGSLAPDRLPSGLNRALQQHWDRLSLLVAQATASHPTARGVTLDELTAACQSIADLLDYWQLAHGLRQHGCYEEACDVCHYGAWARSADAFWRQALKRLAGEICLDDLHRPFEAAVFFRDWLASEEPEDRLTLAQVREHYGEALAALGSHRAAVEQYERALPHAADRPRLYLRIAASHRLRGAHDQAAQALQRLLSSDPRHVEALQEMVSLCLKRDDFAAAQAYVSQAIAAVNGEQASKPVEQSFHGRRLADLYALAAICLAWQGRFDDALRVAGDALDLSSACYQAYNASGLVHLLQRNIPLAIRAFAVSLRAKQDQPEIEAWVERLLDPARTPGETP